MFRSLLCTLAAALFFVIPPLGPATAGVAPPESPEQVAERIQQRYTEITSLSFLFHQTTSGPMAGRAKSGSGNAVFLKTAEQTLMRWNYVEPERQVIISDGDTVSMYFEKLNQMIIAPAETARIDILFSFFTGNSPFAEEFAIGAPTDSMIVESDIGQDELAVLRLTPLQKETQVRTVFLWVSADSLIRRIEIVDDFDTITTLNLSAIEIDPIDPTGQEEIRDRFTFSPPAGTEIIRQ